MLELYVLVALGSIGYAFKKLNIQQRPPTIKNIVPRTKQPSMQSLHESNHWNKVKHEEAVARKAQFAKQQKEREREQEQEQDQGHHQPIVEKFTHNNMQHYGIVKQPTNISTSLPIYEHYTGISDMGYKSKREQSSFFELNRDLGNIGGMEQTYGLERDRMENSLQLQNNVLPFDQVRVGPGVNNGFTDKPMDKLSQELEMRQFAMPKNIDDMRAINNPRMQYSGTVIESGMKEIKRANPVPMTKNRPETTAELTRDHMFKTTGAFLKPAQEPAFDVKHTNRNDTQEGYVGNPVSKEGNMIQDKKSIRASDRPSLSFGIANAFLGKRNTDFGKSSIQVYSNNRDTTSVTTYKGGITSIIKATIAPITDIIKPTKKEEYIEHPRTFGQMQTTFPEKGPTRNPEGLKTTIKETTLNTTPNMNLGAQVPKISVNNNDVARVTIKETTLHSSAVGNMKGPVCLTVYDPEDVARITMKQTTLQASQNMNMHAGTFKGAVYDDDDTMRTTVKETTLNESVKMNIANHNFKGAVYNNDSARTTTKETTLHDTDNMNMKPGTMKGVVYDVDETARTTVKETTLENSEVLNVSNHVYKGQVYNPDNTARVTIKETTMREGEMANVRAGVFKGAVYDPNDVARTTMKETMLDYEAPTYISTNETRGLAIDPDERAKTTGRETLKEPDTNRVTRKNVELGYVFDIEENQLPTTTKETMLGQSIQTNVQMAYESMPGGYVDATMNDKETGREDYGDVDYYGTGSAAANGDGYKVANFEAKETNKETTTDQYFGGGQGKDSKPMSYADIYNASINELRQETLVGREPTQSSQKITYGKEDVHVDVHKETFEYDATDFFEDVNRPTVSDRDMLPRDTRDMYVQQTNSIDTSIINQLKGNPYMNPVLN